MPPAKTPAEEKQNAVTETTPADPLAQAQSELAALKAEKDQWYDKFLRKAAEFDNYRKRSEKEKIDVASLAKSSVLEEILPIVDACERALSSFEDVVDLNESLDRYRQGVELLYKQLSDMLARLGVVRIGARGEKFDPHLHEALIRFETDMYEENTVIEELRKGYLFNDRLLRPAQVKVAIRPQDKKEGRPAPPAQP